MSRLRPAQFAGLALVLLGGTVACAPDMVTAPRRVESRATPSPRCSGVDYKAVRGPQPGKPNGSLRDYPAAAAVCAAWWLDLPDDFVPQALALDSRIAYVVGHRAGEVGQRMCQVAAVDLPSGRTRAFAEVLDASDGSPTCRHGGGTALTDAGLWVLQTARLWLLDPERIGRTDQVRRVWRLGQGVRGSTLAANDGQLVIAGFRPRGHGGARWWSEADVLAPRVDSLVERDPAVGELAMTDSTLVPPRLQGLTFAGDPTRAWFVSSRISCGTLRPGGRARDFVPGAEGLVVSGRDVWTVSEASAAPYRDRAGALVPRLLRLDRTALEASGPATCQF